MVEYYYSDPYILSSSCSSSRSLINFAVRVGGVLDPEFLSQCQITDKNFEKSIKELKQIPIKYDSSSASSSNINFYQQELFLDIDIPYKKQFVNSSEFKQYNPWLNNQNQWNLFTTFNDDLII